jgi:hexosaminidase
MFMLWGVFLSCGNRATSVDSARSVLHSRREGKSEGIDITSQPDQRLPELLPWPQVCRLGDGHLRLQSAHLKASFPKLASDRVAAALAGLSAHLAVQMAPAATEQAVVLELETSSPRYPGLSEDESYDLTVDSRGIRIRAATEFGGLRALATLSQLLRDPLAVPCVEIIDAPRFAWRGLLLDPARHFLELPVLLRTLDAMAMCKLNVLHLHLTDDQGFRLPSAAYPKLPSARHYSVEQLDQLVNHAAGLGIRVVPELDMPGHVTSWLTAYPEWGSQQTMTTDRFGVHQACLDPTSEGVFEAIGHLLGELAERFPDPCIHIGGDEVHPAWWSQDARIGEFMRERGFEAVNDLQAYFNTRVGELVGDLGRQVVAWDEVDHEQLPVDWIVQAWRGATSRDRLLSRGNRVVLSAPYYLDLHYSEETYYGFDPAASQVELVAQEDALLEDPRFAHVAGGMRWTQQWREGAVTLAAPQLASGLLGAEACLWGELVDSQMLDQRLWSRLPGLAERFWSPTDAAPAGSLPRRAERFRGSSLVACGIDLETQLSAQLDQLAISGSWQDIARLLEPVKWYGRLLGEQALAARLAGREMPQARPYGTNTPLDQLADLLPPASESWRRLERLLAATLENSVAGDELLVVLESWRQAAVESSPPLSLKPFLPLLVALADSIDSRLRGQAATVTELDYVSAPQGELMLSIPPTLRAWLLGAE